MLLSLSLVSACRERWVDISYVAAHPDVLKESIYWWMDNLAGTGIQAARNKDSFPNGLPSV